VADDNTRALTPEHIEFLESQAVDTVLAEALGVRSLLTRADTQSMGDHWVNWANFPALAFPWTSEDGRIEYQVRPDDPTEDNRGRKRKYVFHRGMTPVLWAVRPVPSAERIIIVEGTKQCLVAARYAPVGVGVYGIAGCRMWQLDGAPIPDLVAVDGREVVIILDADAAENPEVYAAGVELGQALEMEGATSVTFGRLPGGGKSGLDDVMAGRPEDRRAGYLERIVNTAKSKPADKLPTKKKAQKTDQDGEDKDGRKMIVVNDDRLTVINDLTGALLEKWNAVELFCHGGVISRRKGDTMKPVDKGSFNDLVAETARTVNKNESANGTTYTFAWPDPNTMAAVVSRSDGFAPLDRISHAPFVRPDGTVVTEPGYDEATRTMLIPDGVFAGLIVPEDPTKQEIDAARELILTEWLGDFPFDSDVDRANVLALIVTPAIRSMVPKVPLAVVDGLQMGVGKNLLADSILTVYTGTAAEPMNWVPEADELRKQITAAFRTGAEFFVFDEAHTVEGAPLAQALTAATWQDRILGVSTMANFPNVITWISLGNQVQVKGDLTRRVYRIALRPRYSNPQDRKAESFRHPGQSGLDLGSWTRKHRREIMTAILTLVRAWFAQGQPRPTRGVSFGSFEIWERIVGGIVETAGMNGFLDNLKVWRSESDFDTQYWAGHLGWLRRTFGDDPFRTADVRARAMAEPQSYLAPPKLDDPSDKAYGKALGEAYSRLRGRRYGALWIERAGFAHGHVTVWTVGEDPELDDLNGGAPRPDPEPEPEPAPENEYAEARGPAPEDTDGEGHEEVRGPAVDSDASRSAEPECTCAMTEATMVTCEVHGYDSDEKTLAAWEERAAPQPTEAADLAPVLDVDVLTFDLETGDADQLYHTPGSDYVRIGATAADDGEVIAYGQEHVPAADLVASDIREAWTITGHNIMAFDLPALVRAGAMTMEEIHQMAKEGRIFDGLLAARLIDPPMARDKGVDAQRKYDLATLGQKYGLGEKLTEVSKPLAKKYGGDWGAIPIDVNDPDLERATDAALFIGYMKQDVELSRSLHAALLAELGGTVPDYLAREHRVAALAAQVSMNGFLVDQELLTERVTEVDERKAESLAWLAEHAGIPLADAKGKPYKSPLATKLGKEALEAAFVKAGATSFWRTGVSNDFATSAEHMRHLGREYHHLPQVREIAKNVYRIVSARSVYQTALDNLCPDGRVHPKVGFEQATGRWSVTRPGLTVFGKRGGRHVERAVFLPDPGEVLIAADLSQVDMRAVAGLSQDQAYIRMLETDDPHSELAVALFGDAGFREQAKAIGHGWNYGESLKRISMDNEIDPAIVRRFDTSMYERFPRLVEWREEVRALAGSGALLDNGFGRKMRADPQRAHTQGPALMGQGAARDIMMEGLLRLPAEIRPMLRAQIHDEIVLSVPADRAEELGRAVVDAMTFDWKGVPIMADVSKTGTDWSLCYAK
jgi:DNA polymerase I-like protein with 3'-5' exonuclease and polymerase domains